MMPRKSKNTFGESKMKPTTKIIVQNWFNTKMSIAY